MKSDDLSQTMESDGLSQIATAVNREHAAVLDAIGTALQHARRAGELLLEAKKSVPHGSWSAWLQANFEGTQRHATNYIRIAREWSKLEAQIGNAVSDLPIREAIQLLRRKPKRPKRPQEHVDSSDHPPRLKLLTEEQFDAALREREEEDRRTTHVDGIRLVFPSSTTHVRESRRVRIISEVSELAPQRAEPQTDSAALDATRRQVASLKAAWNSANPVARNEFRKWLAR